MGEIMRHLTDEELIDHYYAEDLYKAEAEMHLHVCGRCAQTYEELGRVLGSVHTPEAPTRSSEYGEHVWQAIRGDVQPYQAKKKRSYFQWPQFAYAAACLMVAAVAFLGGRYWEHAHTGISIASAPQPSKERVVLFVLDNHLDRSERLLVQLNHAGEEKVDLPLQTEARQLLTDNRLYRQSLTKNNDPMLAAALDHLERVLLEIANSPDDLTSADVTRIEQEMNTQGLLFQIRVLRTKVSEQETHAQVARKGVSL
jgi:hypothetical protein